MKQPALAARQAIALINLDADVHPALEHHVDVMRLSALGYISPQGPGGQWTITEAGIARALLMMGHEETFNPAATEAVIAFIKGHANLDLWEKNLHMLDNLTGDLKKDDAAIVLKLREVLGILILQATKFDIWEPPETPDGACAKLAYSLAHEAMLELVDWEEVLKLWKK